MVLFGAPLTTHISQTAVCAAHVSLLTALPLIYVYGVDTSKWRRIAALMVPIDEVFGAAVGCCLGAWIGAVPIPLDWDREWQKWPVTIVTGAYIGWAVGKGAGGLLAKGKVIDLSP
jgi:phosphatidylinositol glycan class F